MEIKKEELIKDLLLSNHELLKQIIINNERKCTEPAADYIIKTMKNIRVEEITDVMEKFIYDYNLKDNDLFTVSIETPQEIYKIKIGTHRTKNIKSTLERSEILNRLEDSNIPAPL
ncbi:hypothetical protein OZ348_004560, partial [Salmonella enterica subsp. enterica serovar Infantis]|nr:hypothetical protein [Salmonella enterica subsp. enterica serovar Infantis]ELV7007811.1 hypothetical protein [Salmonella enterica]